ncbi:hypothetical protein ED733_002865 [Metarhizium rileyi]|uniref:Uncharacterized protein n=1 Tax=Metarhizium rileyi (strain RCEF 4871) TaxID=1649241 RepID=A0A5C6GN73_METRR|nr:hypothetical protein ED733_002865 [Metarhizium rileyi]
MIFRVIALVGLCIRLSVADGTGSENAGRITIGFRTVGQEEKNLLTKTKTLVQSRNTAATHIGRGVYIANNPIPHAGHSVFIITADEAVFKSTPKVWVPEEYWTLPLGKDDFPSLSGDREDKICRDQLEHYIEDQGLDSTLTLRIGKIAGSAKDDIEQLLIPNEVLARDQTGLPIENSYGHDFKVQEPVNPIFWGVDYHEWEEIKGSRVYTQDTLRERSSFLVNKATEAATRAKRALESDSPTAAEEMADALAIAQRCAEGVGHFHRKRSNWVGFEDFNMAYEQYAITRKAAAALRKSMLIKSMEAHKSKVAQVDEAKDAADRASRVAEAEKAAEKSRELLKASIEEAASLKEASEKLNSIRQVLNGGDQEAYMRVLLDNPRAVWARLQETFLIMNQKIQPSMDAAIIDEASIASEEYTHSQKGVDEAQVILNAIEERMKALSETTTPAETPDETEKKKEAEDAEAEAREKEEAEKAEAKRKEEAEKAHAKAVDSAQKIASNAGGNPWLGTVLGSVAGGLAAVAGSAFMTASVAGGMAGAGLSAGGAIAGGLGAAASVPLLSAEASVSVTAAEVASVVAEVDPQLALEMLLDTAPEVSKALPSLADAAAPVAIASKRDDASPPRDVSAKWAFQVAAPALERAFEESLRLAIKEARLEMNL